MASKLYDEWGAFTAIPNDFIENSRELSSQARWLFVLLRMNRTNRMPSYNSIQESTGYTHKTIAAAIKELINNDWMSREKSDGYYTYTLHRHHFPTGSSTTSQREVEHFPLGSKSLPNGKRINKIEDREIKKPPTIDEDLGTALEDIFPGYANNFKILNQLRTLVKQQQASSLDVRAFPDWLVNTYPHSPLSPYKFLDLLPVMLKAKRADNISTKTTCGTCSNGYIIDEYNIARACNCQK